jgi:hypothetical protein
MTSATTPTGPPPHLEALQIERSSKQDAFPHVHKVTARDIPGIGAPINERSSETRSTRIDADLRLVPSWKPVVRNGKENGIASRQHVRKTLTDLATGLIGSDNLGRRTAKLD